MRPSIGLKLKGPRIKTLTHLTFLSLIRQEASWRVASGLAAGVAASFAQNPNLFRVALSFLPIVGLSTHLQS